MNERVNESISRSILKATRTGINGFNKIMSVGNGFNKVIMHILPSRQEREIMFEATRACIWFELEVCSMRVRFPTQQHDTSGLINHQVKYFAKANSAFTIFLHRRHERFIVYQFRRDKIPCYSEFHAHALIRQYFWWVLMSAWARNSE